jgi:hypothetical protein
MEAAATVVIGFIVFIALTTAACEALFFTAARKLHTAYTKTDFGEEWSAFARAYVATAPKAFGAGGEGS